MAERVPYSVGRDDMWRPGQGSVLRLREGSPGTASRGGVCLKACLAAVVAVLQPHDLAGRLRHGWGIGYWVE